MGDLLSLLVTEPDICCCVKAANHIHSRKVKSSRGKSGLLVDMSKLYRNDKKSIGKMSHVKKGLDKEAAKNP